MEDEEETITVEVVVDETPEVIGDGHFVED